MLNPEIQSVDLNSQFTVNLWMDFSAEPIVGGGIVLEYDQSQVAFQDFNWDSAFAYDPALSEWNGDTLGQIVVRFGSFAGLTGPSIVGAFDFNSLFVESASMLALVPDELAYAFSPIDFNQPLPNVTLNSATVNIVPSAVPLPAAVWLFLSSLGMLGLLQRRKSWQRNHQTMGSVSI